MRKIFLNPVIAVLALAIGAAWLAGCSRKAPPKKVVGVPVLVAQATNATVPVQIDPPPVGHVMALSTVTVHSQIQGMISEIHFQEGQEVNKGDLLFTIDPRPSQALLDQARANLERDSGQLEYARANYSRDQKLLDAKIISQDQLDTDRASLDASTGTVAADQAAITNALLNLDYCQIRAPVDGRTGSLQAYVGNVVKAPDDVLVTINQIRPIYVAFAVPEQYLPQIRDEMRDRPLNVSVTYQNMSGPTPEGELTFVDNSVDQTTGTILLKATFPNDDRTLWPGQFVNVTLTLSELTNAVVVPSQAVQTGQEGQFIYVVTANPTNAAVPTVEDRPITTGITYQNETVVEKGVQAGETVVTDGQLRLMPGVTVNIKSPAPVTATDSVTNVP
jgi:multidrug efflux system membrane fusion protein